MSHGPDMAHVVNIHTGLYQALLNKGPWRTTEPSRQAHQRASQAPRRELKQEQSEVSKPRKLEVEVPNYRVIVCL